MHFVRRAFRIASRRFARHACAYASDEFARGATCIVTVSSARRALHPTVGHAKSENALWVIENGLFEIRECARRCSRRLLFGRSRLDTGFVSKVKLDEPRKLNSVSTVSIQAAKLEPRRRIETSAAVRRAREATAAAPRRSSAAGELLLVDDDQTILNILSAALTNAGYRCHTTNDPQDALRRAIQNEAVSVVVSDIFMPGMNGLEFIGKLSAEPLNRPCPRFLLLTAQPSLHLVVDALRLGVCDFLMKPVRIPDLCAAVERALMEAEADRRGYESPLERVERLIRESQELTGHLRELAASGAAAGSLPMLDAAAEGPYATDDSAILDTIEVLRETRARYAQHRLDDVAWDLLLELARVERLRQRVSVSGLMISSGSVSATTLLRRINDLAERGYVVRTPDPKDARRDFVSLTPKGQELVSDFLQNALGRMHDLASTRYRR